MRKFLIPAALCVAVASMSAVASAQGKPQTIINYRVDVTHVATGFRASKLIGATIYNEAKENIGKIDDLLVTPNDRVFYAVLSVGGFLCMGDKLVAVRYDALNMNGEHIVLPEGTKESLKKLPAFAYTK